MTDTLVSVVDSIITRLLVLQPLAVTDTKLATKRWVYLSQDTPYWVNRVGAIRPPSGAETFPTYELFVQMRLILSYEAGIMREDNVDGNAQEQAWEYIPQVVRYFELNRDLSPTGYDALTHINVAEVRIDNPRGLDLQVLPMSREILLSTDFELTIPIRVGNSEV